MRALNLSPVVLTGCCLLWPTLAGDSTPTEANFPRQGPSSIKVLPFPLTANKPFTVFWLASPNATVEFVNFIEVDPTGFGGPLTSTLANAPLATYSCITHFNEECSAILGASSSAVGTAPTILQASRTYQANLIWISPTDANVPLYTSTWPDTSLAVLPVGSQTPETPVISSTVLSTVASTVQPSAITSGAGSGTAVSIPTSASTTSSLLASGTAIAGVVSSSNSSGLSTGTKVGIAIGAVGFALIIIIATLLVWRRSRQKQLRAQPNGMPYSHDIGSTNRDFTAEKEMHVINSPVDTLQNGYSSISPVAETQSRSQRGSYPLHDGHAVVADVAGTTAAYAHPHRDPYGSGYGDSTSPVRESQVHMPPPAAAAAAAAGAAIQRKPVGATGGPTHHLREPGMSDEEVERLEEEERRLDEAIAEAERRRQL